MNLFSISSLILCFSCFSLAIIILIYGRNKLSRLWALFNLSIAVWAVGIFFAGKATTELEAIAYWRMAHVGGLFIAIFFYHTICLFCKINRRKIILVSYLQGLFFIFMNFTPLFISSVRYVFDSFYYNKATIFYSIALINWLILVILGHYELVKEYLKTTSINRNKIRYFIVGFFVGFLGGFTYFIPMYGLDIYPIGNFTIPLYCLVGTYAILKYRILDIRIAVTRAGAFGIVYALVLGIPFWIGFRLLGKGLWIVPVSITAIFATVGPFSFLFIQRKTEDRILKEERGDKQFLAQASAGMTRIRSLKKLLGLINHILSQRLKVSNVGIYLLDPETNQYVLKASRLKYKNPISIKIDDPLIQWLKKDNSPLVYEEIKMRVDMEANNHALKEIKSQVEELAASVIIPAVMQDHILGFLVLGERKSKRMYTTDLLNALSVLSNQAALAIENAIFYEETGKTLAQQFQENRLKSLGKLSGGMAHQMFNVFDIISMGSEITLELLKTNELENLTPEELTKLKEKLIANLKTVVDAVQRGTGVTEAIKNYAKADKQPGMPSVVSFKKIIFDCKELALLKYKDDKLVFELIEDYPKDTTLWVNCSTFQDAILNAIDNSCDAMISKRDLIKAGRLDIKDYKPCIIVRGKKNNTMFEFEIEDNGIGMTEEQLKHGIGTPLFTTKGKGTGLGVSMMYQFIRQNKGDIRVESQHQKWTKIIISLPLATKDQIEQSKENKDGDQRH